MSQPLVLGIETSCDETAIGIVRGRTLLANEIASSVQEHARFGGVVPEIASRAHVEAMIPALDRALKTAKVSLNDVDAIAVTAGPGLVGALLVGTSTASAIALALDKPLYGVNHLAAHISVDYLTHDKPLNPTIAFQIVLHTVYDNTLYIKLTHAKPNRLLERCQYFVRFANQDQETYHFF